MSLAAVLAVTAAIAVAAPAAAQDHSMHNMPGMTMPAPAKKPTPKMPAARKVGATPARRAPANAAPKPSADGAMPGMAMPSTKRSQPAKAQDAMPGMDMGTPSGGSSMQSMPGMDMSGGAKNSGAMPGMAMTGTALPAGDAPAPPPPMDHYADRQFPASEMARARNDMMRDSGGRSFSQIMFNLAEVQIRNGRDGYRWDGEGWFGGDINRLTVKTEGEGVFREGVVSAEIQALYSRAIGPYFNLQAGVRHDFQPSPTRTYATVGFEGLAPYWFEVEGALFLSNKGDVLGRLEGYYDQRITQRMILQPRVELNLSAQDVPENRLGAGLTNAEIGLRLRYEISRQFAPYVGISYDAKTGRTADFARADGDKATSTSLVGGVRFWF
ncbi:Copper resistance protein CopB [Sphingomonas antarctica]|uniref:copper resistance protein B n=1 Tax=Sphingomonas antarctica TaxID=2040274 RepID=UPI0039ECDA9C